MYNSEARVNLGIYDWRYFCITYCGLIKIQSNQVWHLQKYNEQKHLMWVWYLIEKNNAKLKIYQTVGTIDVTIYQIYFLTSNIHTVPFKLIMFNNSSRIVRCHVGFDISFPLTTHRCFQTNNMMKIQSCRLPQVVNC